MSKKLYEESNIQDIADAIREKNKTENTYKVSEMANAILSLPSSAAVIEPLRVSANGRYAPPTGVDGYAPVTVDVSGGVDTSKLNYWTGEGVAIADGRYASNFTSRSRDLHLITESGSALSIDWSSPWEIMVTAMYSQTSGNSQVLFGDSGGFFRGCTIEFGPNGTGIYAAVSNNGTSWTTSFWFANQTDIDLEPGMYYSIILGYDGENVYSKITTAESETQLRTETGSVAAVASPIPVIGGIGHSSRHYAQYCVVDLHKCYVKSNGTLIWGVQSLKGSDWNDNLAINWDFANPVNTKGQTSYSTQSSEVETVDGWTIQNGAVELEDDGIRLSRRSNYSGDAYFQQHFSTNGANFCYGETITLTVIFDGKLYSSTFDAPSTTGIYTDSVISLGENTNLAVAYFNNSTTIEFFLRDDAQNHVVNAIKLEVGSRQTLATKNAETDVWILNKAMTADDERIKRKIVIKR